MTKQERLDSAVGCERKAEAMEANARRVLREHPGSALSLAFAARYSGIAADYRELATKWRWIANIAPDAE